MKVAVSQGSAALLLMSAVSLRVAPALDTISLAVTRAVVVIVEVRLSVSLCHSLLSLPPTHTYLK